MFYIILSHMFATRNTLSAKFTLKIFKFDCIFPKFNYDKMVGKSWICGDLIFTCIRRLITSKKLTECNLLGSASDEGRPISFDSSRILKITQANIFMLFLYIIQANFDNVKAIAICSVPERFLNIGKVSREWNSM